jgi:hypothetical protein
MNTHSGPFPADSTALAVSSNVRPPVVAGLREVALAGVVKREGAFDVTEYWRIIVKWRWLILAITVACLLAAVLVSLLMTPLYRATATMEVNPEGVQVVQMGDVQSMGMDDRAFLATQAGLLRSRTLAARVAADGQCGRIRRKRAAVGVHMIRSCGVSQF